MSRVRRRGSGLAVNGGLALGVTLALLGSLELYARHRHPGRHARLWSVNLDREHARFDPRRMRLVDMIRVAPWRDLVYELRPSVRGLFWTIPYRFNSHGMRDRETTLEKPPGVFRIALLGDSFGFAWGVRMEQGYAELLEWELRGSILGKRVEVLNFAVPGYNLAMKAACLEHRAMAFDPDLILVEYYKNDAFLPNFVLDEAEPPDLYLLDWIREATARLSAPDRPEAGAPPELVPGLYTQDRGRVPAELRYMVGFEGVERALERIRAIAGRADLPAALLVITMPEGALAELPPDDGFFGPEEQRVAEAAQDLGYTTLNTLAPFLRWARDSGNSARSVMRTESDSHPSVVGHEILAATVAAGLGDAGLLGPAGSPRPAPPR